MPKRDIPGFIAHWSAASPSERANSQAFLLELCELLEVPAPDNHPNAGFFFEYPVTEHHPDGTTSNGRIDLYKRACFILESKQFQEAKTEPSQLELAAESIGAISKRKKSAAPVRDTDRWDDAMLKAQVQAERYARALPESEPNPPFMLVVDVGHVIEVRADFTQAGRAYLPFPDPLTYRIRLDQLRDEKICARLKSIWTNPQELNPASHSAAVTQEVAKHLAELAKSFEKQGHKPKIVAEFLTRCLFCMFAEDVGLLPDTKTKGFTELLKSLPSDGNGFEDVMRTLFREMNTGTGKSVSVILRRKLLQFNGGLFADDSVLPVTGTQLGILKAAAGLDWKHVEPAIFGTLLERALGGEGERHKLGAHFTPRAYVERLVLPTLIQPLREEWESVRAAAVALGKRGEIESARKEINRYHDRLCEVTVLDPACGSGNFLYVALEHLKRLEGEVLDFANQFGESFRLELTIHTVDPHQFLGLEINPHAAAITELVLWIGYLQWHFRTRGQTPPREPVLKKFDNIQCRDAVLEYDGDPQPVTWAMALANPDLPGLPDDVRAQLRSGASADRRKISERVENAALCRDAATPEADLITVWDRRSVKRDLVTGRDVPDETKRLPLLTYANPRPTIWPEANFIVGNPPFIGKKRLRESLGEGYAETLRATYTDVPETADFVMYWWQKAAQLVRTGKVKRFGFITTNSLSQSFGRQILESHLNADPPLSLVFAIADHPWVDSNQGAAVRIAMTVGVAGNFEGELLQVKEERTTNGESANIAWHARRGKINPDLEIIYDSSAKVELQANLKLSSVGYQLNGTGFTLDSTQAKALQLADPQGVRRYVFPLLSARDITQTARGLVAIDLFGTIPDELRECHPAIYQWVLNHVKPERDSNPRQSRRERWWIYGEALSTFRPALRGLSRVIITPLTAKHRTFVFTAPRTIADSTTVIFAFDDAFFLGVLSSRLHVVFALDVGSHLGVGNDPRYNKSLCFESFPFPLCGEREKARIRELAEALDAHRKQVQAKHGVTLTGLYNVLEKLRAVGTRSTASQTPTLTRGKDGDDVEVVPTLTAKEKLIHDRGLVSTLKSLHDDLDAAVFAAYAWPASLTDAEILERLVALNAERAAEEKRGVIHWLRPEYQIGKQKAETGKQKELTLPEGKTKSKARKTPHSALRTPKLTWPKALAERVQVVQAALHASGAPVAPADMAKQFKRAQPADVAEILQTLVTLGRARRKGNQFTR